MTPRETAAYWRGVRDLAILLAILALLGIAGGVDRASASELSHITPDRCTIVATIENPIECHDWGDDSDSRDGGESDDRAAIRRGRDRQASAEDWADRTLRRWREQDRCAEAKTRYYARHPLVKPWSLRGLYGCDLYESDAAYHSEVPDQPGVRGLLAGLIV